MTTKSLSTRASITAAKAKTMTVTTSLITGLRTTVTGQVCCVYLSNIQVNVMCIENNRMALAEE
jgi:hypothetical protein